MLETEKFEIPVPYGVEPHFNEGLMYFDYRIKTLAHNNPDIENYLKIYTRKSGKNKFWDSILTITTNE
jgi:hypothetical protein